VYTFYLSFAITIYQLATIFMFCLIMGAWTFTTLIIAIYSIIHNYPGIFKAISPLYSICLFLRNKKHGCGSCLVGLFYASQVYNTIPFSGLHIYYKYINEISLSPFSCIKYSLHMKAIQLSSPVII
jgi:hypothetical protein